MNCYADDFEHSLRGTMEDQDLRENDGDRVDGDALMHRRLLRPARVKYASAVSPGGADAYAYYPGSDFSGYPGIQMFQLFYTDRESRNLNNIRDQPDKIQSRWISCRQER